MFLVYLVLLINLPFYFLRLVESIKELKRIFIKIKINIENKDNFKYNEIYDRK